MSIRAARRKALLLTQEEAARRAAVSIATWRRWEKDATSIDAVNARRCDQVLGQEVRPFETDSSWLSVFRVWNNHEFIRPAMAAALSITLTGWADSLGQHLRNASPRVPESRWWERGLFVALDPRVAIHVNGNAPWLALAERQTRVVAMRLEVGSHSSDDTRASLFDRLVILAATREASVLLRTERGYFDSLPALPGGGAADWANFSQRIIAESPETPIAAFLKPDIPESQDHFPAAVAKHHPYTWFDRIAAGD